MDTCSENKNNKITNIIISKPNPMIQFDYNENEMIQRSRYNTKLEL